MWVCCFCFSNWGFYHHVCSSLCLSNSQIPSQIHCCPLYPFPAPGSFLTPLCLSQCAALQSTWLYLLHQVCSSLCPGQSCLRCLSCAIWIIALNNNMTSCLQWYFLHLDNMISEYMTLSPCARIWNVKMYLLVCGHLQMIFFNLGIINVLLTY